MSTPRVIQVLCVMVMVLNVVLFAASWISNQPILMIINAVIFASNAFIIGVNQGLARRISG